MKLLSDILGHLFRANWFDPVRPDSDLRARSDARVLNAAFLIALAGQNHKKYSQSFDLLSERSENEPAAAFYREGISRINSELRYLFHTDTDFKNRLQDLADWCSIEHNLSAREATQEKIWSVFCPEACGIRGNEEKSVQDLRNRRKINIRQSDRKRTIDPASQLLFTSNVLLTTPFSTEEPELILSADILKNLESVKQEKQKYWYDHPIPLGINPARNEFLYGMTGLDQALEFEKKRGTLSGEGRIPCVISASVTHTGLHKLVKEYLFDCLKKEGGVKHLDIYVFTEADCRRIITDVLIPAYSVTEPKHLSDETFSMFGVDGEYGRHYSFLKAMCAFWHVFVDPRIQATFKIDLDQIFPQENLVAETGASMFELFSSDLWSAFGEDESGNTYQLGMIAGALVNQGDIGTSLFTPDVKFPQRSLSPDESIFYSILPQALSTQAEMMTRYRPDSEPDGIKTCIQRIHVTGGTNGILVDSLFDYQPFTPSFIGRAEDQAYIMSTFSSKFPRLAYVHQDGLIMRHDKHSFAQKAIQAAETGKSIGDYIRILLFSKYAQLVSQDFREVKNLLDPFTGCFISKLPITVTLLRFALKAGHLFATDQTEQAEQFIKMGAERLEATLKFTKDPHSPMQNVYAQEKEGWKIFYKTLHKMKHLLEIKDPAAEKIARTAREIVAGCLIRV